MTKPRLLVVEDDPGLAAQCRWAFPDWKVLLASDRGRAEAAARQEAPAVVLLDLGLPPDAEGVGEGFATLETLRREKPDLPVVVASGQGPRAKKPFIAINRAAIPETLLEAELFGHEKRAFTGATRQVIGKVELADGGTLFLDEIGEMPATLRAKMLRLPQDQVTQRIGGRSSIKVDVRVVSAANQPLEEQAGEGRFRGDLLYRPNTMTLRIPPLRERGGDAALLACGFLARFAQEYGRKLRGFEPAALEAIAAHRWPGNIRELLNRVCRAPLMSDGALASAADLDLVAAEEPGAADGEFDLRAARLRAGREVLERALARANGRLAIAGRLLGASRHALYALLETDGLAARGASDAG
jgi:two-component system NtrC family response regulator